MQLKLIECKHAEIKQMYFAVRCAAFLWNTFDKINTKHK